MDGNYANYIYGIKLIQSGYSWYLYNAHGDVVQLVDGSGTVTKSYDYDPYGVALTDDDPGDANPYRYCGEYLDHESGYVYLRARYYDPSIGRFISVDAAMDGHNWYSYCAGNPLSFIDPTGMTAWWQWALAGTQIVAGAALCATGVGVGLGATLMDRRNN